MLIAIIGENCVGKSTLANNIKQAFGANIYTGKDYLRLEKNPSVAIEKFKSILQESVSGGNIIYLITEQDHLNLLPQGTIKIVLTASLETIKARFKERMRGNLPFPVEKMLLVREKEKSKKQEKAIVYKCFYHIDTLWISIRHSLWNFFHTDQKKSLVHSHRAKSLVGFSVDKNRKKFLLLKLAKKAPKKSKINLSTICPHK